MSRFDMPSIGLDNATTQKYTGTKRPGPFSGTYTNNSNRNTGNSGGGSSGSSGAQTYTPPAAASAPAVSTPSYADVMAQMQA